jgi:chlorite dismutase
VSGGGELIGWVSFWKPKDEWYYLPLDERERLLGEWGTIRAAAVGQGATQFGTYECRASTAWARVSFWEFPDLGVLTEMVDALSDAAYYQYFAEENAFGRRTEDPYGNYVVAADATLTLGGE